MQKLNKSDTHSTVWCFFQG